MAGQKAYSAGSFILPKTPRVSALSTEVGDFSTKQKKVGFSMHFTPPAKNDARAGNQTLVTNTTRFTNGRRGRNQEVSMVITSKGCGDLPRRTSDHRGKAQL